MTRPTHINPNCHCGAPLRPRVEVFANADADEWVCSAGCTGGVFFDWTSAQFVEALWETVGAEWAGANGVTAPEVT